MASARRRDDSGDGGNTGADEDGTHGVRAGEAAVGSGTGPGATDAVGVAGAEAVGESGLDDVLAATRGALGVDTQAPVTTINIKTASDLLIYWC